MEQRANIKFCFKLGKTAQETFTLMKNVYGDQCLSRAQVFRWFARFRDGREDLEDNERSPKPRTSRNETNIEKVSQILRSDRCVSARLIEEMTGIPKSVVHRILTDDLGKKKICARFVPHSLSKEQKDMRVSHCKDMKSAKEKDPVFMSSIVTGDETWCFQYEPLTKRQSAIWKSPDEPKEKKVRMQKSRIKTMLTVFFDSKGIIHKEFIPEGQTVNAQCYLGVLKRLWGRIYRVRPEYKEVGSWFLLHDNAPSHKALIVREFLAKKSIITLDHPPYSPDLAPCDFWLFPKLKLAMKRKTYSTIPTIQKASTDILKAIPAHEYQTCFDKFYDRLQRCINSEGDYFE